MWTTSFRSSPLSSGFFNSKLLISQVLGRGLRLPREVNLADIQRNYPVVTITNHERFAQHIQELLDEVTECELRFISDSFKTSDQKRFDRNFHLFNLEYLPTQRLEDRSEEEIAADPATRELRLTPSSEKLGVRVVYREGTKRFELSKEYFTVDQIVLDVERRFKNTVFESRHFDFGDGLVIDQVPGREEIEKAVRLSMKKEGIEGDRLSRENRQQIDLFFNQFLPKGKKKVVRENIEGAITGISTEDMPGKSARSGGLDHDITVFVSEDYEKELKDQNLFVLQTLMNQDRQLTIRENWLPSQEDYNREYVRQMLPFKNLYALNTSLLRTPQDLVIVSHEPERHFIFRLIENAKWISSWIKSPDREFYSLEYEYWKGEKDRVRRPFNPDFFIRVRLSEYLIQLGINANPQVLYRLRGFQDQGVEDLILVVEIKDDDDTSTETRAKGDYGKDHFQALNRRLRETNPIDLPENFRDSLRQQYFFFILRPKEYPGWFAKLQNGLITWE